MAKTKTKADEKDVLSPTEIQAYKDVQTVLVEGDPYLWIVTFGWAKIGYYVKHISPTRILIAHCNHFRNGGKHYGLLATEGAGENCEWRYEGELIELSTNHIIQTNPYNGRVNRDPTVGANNN